MSRAYFLRIYLVAVRKFTFSPRGGMDIDRSCVPESKAAGQTENDLGAGVRRKETETGPPLSPW